MEIENVNKKPIRLELYTENMKVTNEQAQFYLVDFCLWL